MAFLAPLALLLAALAIPIILLYMLRLRRREANAPWQRLKRNLLPFLQLITPGRNQFIMAKRPKKITEVQRTVLPHLDLANAAWYTLTLAEETEKARDYNCMFCMIMCALWLEAFLNFVGPKAVKSWKEIERALKPKQKLTLLSEIIGYQVDYGRRPFQTFGEIFAFRNRVVHAKPESLEDIYEQELTEQEADEFIWGTEPPKTPPMPATWIDQCTLENARRYYKDTNVMAETIRSHMGLEYPFQKTTWSATLRYTDKDS